MSEKTLIYIVIGCAATGVIYYLWKQEQGPSTPSNSQIIAGNVNTVWDDILGATIVSQPGGATLSQYF